MATMKTTSWLTTHPSLGRKVVKCVPDTNETEIAFVAKVGIRGGSNCFHVIFDLDGKEETLSETEFNIAARLFDRKNTALPSKTPPPVHNQNRRIENAVTKERRNIFKEKKISEALQKDRESMA
jgi:hypothetical protein